MARNKLGDLLPATSAGNASRSDLLGQLAASTGSGSGTGGSSAISAALVGVGTSGVTDQLSSLATQIISLTTAQQSQISTLQDNTQALTQNTTSRSSGGSSLGSTVASAASSFVGADLSALSPLIGGILNMFGGSSQTPSQPSPFILPSPVQSNAGMTASAPGQVVPVSYGETGQPRSTSQSPPTQVTVQVNAMDSQSFLDHSDEIAMAVKQAILSSSSLNDVISGL